MLHHFRNHARPVVLAVYLVCLMALGYGAIFVATLSGWPYLAKGSQVALLVLSLMAVLRAVPGTTADLLAEIEQVIYGLLCLCALLTLRHYLGRSGYGPVNLFEVITAALLSYFGLPAVTDFIRAQYYTFEPFTARALLRRAEEAEESCRDVRPK